MQRLTSINIVIANFDHSCTQPVCQNKVRYYGHVLNFCTQEGYLLMMQCYCCTAQRAA